MAETIWDRLKSTQNTFKMIFILTMMRQLIRWYYPAIQSWTEWVILLAVFFISDILNRISAKIRRRTLSVRNIDLQILSEPKKPNFEIVAIHGLGANPEYTWVSKSSAKLHDGKRIHLLKDLLVHDYPNARIISYSYNSDWLIDAPEKTFHCIANQLKEQLEKSRSPLRPPIIFVGHSFGGIVIKETLVQCHNDPNPVAQSIFQDTCGVIFLGTPHHGTSISTLAAMAINLTRFQGSNDSLVLPLQYHNSELLKLNLDFNRCQEEQEQAGQRKKLKTISFCETKPTYFGGVSLGLIVDQTSANGNASKLVHVDTDHSGLNKCSGRDDQLYKYLTNSINELQCPPPLELADKLIHDFYSKSERLDIERLSGELLPMNQCYINLAIIERASAAADDKSIRPSSMSLSNRLQIEEPPEARKVNLPELFDTRENQSGEKKKPNRIFIRGRAGVGKTTLCKKIVHEFLEHDMWNDLFDRIIWLPLRRLKRRADIGDDRYDIETMVCDEFFSRTDSYSDQERRHLAHILCQEFKPPNTKTLFLLDGLDEIRGLDHGSDTFSVLQRLLNQSHVIITSRPGAPFQAKMDPVDLELETIGFYSHQVNEYLKKNTNNPTQIHEIESFLRSHRLLRDLVRIPIQLDALCFTWEYFKSTTINQTMTGIYQAIEQRLWMKDILRCKKRIDGELIDDSTVSDLQRPDIENVMDREIKILEILAFTGIYNDVIEFTSDHQRVISRHPEASLLSIYLPRLSFLRASDRSSTPNRSYHFLHLTFQEFFAARYFIRKWKKFELECIDLTTGKLTNMEHTRFIKKYKYAAQFDIFWRFVTGLFTAEDNTVEFFDSLENQPLDLLGPTHQRLLMHCMNEAGYLPESIKSRLEDDLFKCLNLELDVSKSPRFPAETDFPDQVLLRILQDRELSISKQRKILYSLKNRSNFSPDILELAFSWLAETTRTGLEDEAKQMLSDFHGILPESILEAMANSLNAGIFEHIGLYIRSICQLDVPLKIVKHVVSMIENPDESIKIMTIEAVLNPIRPKPVKVLQAIAAQLKHQNKKVRSAAVRTLGSQPNLNLEIFEELVTQLQDQEKEYRENAVTILCDQSKLPPEILQYFAMQLTDEREEVRETAVSILSRQSRLQMEISDILVNQLEDQEKHIRQNAATILGCQNNLHIKIYQALAIRLKDRRRETREATISALGTKKSLPLEILRGLAALLEDQLEEVRKAATRAFSQLSSIPQEFLQALAARLEDQDKDIRSYAFSALERQLNPPPEIFQALAARLEDEYDGIRVNAAAYLIEKPNLPQSTIQALTEILKGEDYGAKINATSALCYQPNLPLQILQTLAAQLEDQNEAVREMTAQSLGRQLDLPLHIIIALMKRLADQEHRVRWVTVGALCKLPNLPLQIFQFIITLLDRDYQTSWDTVNALCHRKCSLPSEIIQAIAERLKSQNNNIRSAAIAVLGNQRNLPLEILHAIAARLGDRVVQEKAAKTIGNQLEIPHEFLQEVLEICIEKGLVEEVEYILEKQDKGYHLLLAGMSVEQKRQILQSLSWKKHIALYVDNDEEYISTLEGVEKFI